MNNKEPEQLHEKTPQWFKDWHSGTFWHFKYHVENKLSWHDKLLWVILAAIFGTAIGSFFF